MPQLWSLLNHSQTEGWFSGRAKKMWIHQAHWHIAHTTNTHTSWLNTSDTGERWARAEAYDQEVEQPHKLPSLLILQLTAELEDFTVWLWAICECGHFYVYVGYKGHGLRGSNLHSYFGQCTIKTSTQPDGFPRRCELGPLAPKAYKIEPRLDPSSRVTDRAPNGSYQPLANPQHK